MLRNDMDAEDLLQNSFVDIYGKINTFRFQSSIGAWIKRIVINNCINFLKKRRLEIVSLEHQHDDRWDEPEPTDSNLSLKVKDVKSAISQLPDGYRVVFNLYTLEGYDHKEIAEILDVSEATSKSQYSRAKKKLREMLGQGVARQ
jgi:RNA polymerase sigma-70 factor (ECF subfamily)